MVFTLRSSSKIHVNHWFVFALSFLVLCVLCACNKNYIIDSYFWRVVVDGWNSTSEVWWYVQNTCHSLLRLSKQKCVTPLPNRHLGKYQLQCHIFGTENNCWSVRNRKPINNTAINWYPSVSSYDNSCGDANSLSSIQSIIIEKSRNDAKQKQNHSNAKEIWNSWSSMNIELLLITKTPFIHEWTFFIYVYTISEQYTCVHKYIAAAQ